MKDLFRPIYEPRTRAREYADLAINIYTGCNHGCIYCYAPKVLRKTAVEFSAVEPRKDIVESTRKQIEREQIKGKTILLCFTCDPYPEEVDTSVTREIIKIIKESGNNVQILTKGGKRAERDFDLLDEHDSFGITWSGYDAHSMFIKSPNEPNAAIPAERISSLARARQMGIRTWVSCEPVFEPKSIYSLIEAENHIDLFKIGKLNYMPSNINWGKFGRECERLCILHGRNYYIKEDLRKEMGDLE